MCEGVNEFDLKKQIIYILKKDLKKQIIYIKKELKEANNIY